jgi:O-6-methylguanine DNA methyltransferase
MEEFIGVIMDIYRLEYESPIGPLTLWSSDEGLCYIGFNSAGDRGQDFIKRHYPGAVIKPGGEFNRQAAREITDYLNGRLTKFLVKLDLKASGFNREVLQRVKAIPFGTVCTYGEIAAKLGSPKAARAVGNANRLNPIPIIIPCHRVVATNGLGGYGGGLDLKKELLRREGIAID